MEDNNLKNVDIRPQLSKLTNKEKLLVAAKIRGYSHLPVRIEQFLFDDYYLGPIFKNSLYPFWLEKLKEIYPNEIMTRYPYISLGGAIGTGKSTMSRVMALYTLHRLDCMTDPWKTMKLAKGKAIALAFQHTSKEVAVREFLKPIWDIMELSPYFQNMYNNHNIVLVPTGIRDQNTLGNDVIFGVQSEINFIPYDIAKSRLDTLMIRYKSRFGNHKYYIGNIILDSSAKGSSSVVEDYVRENALGNDLFTVRASHWEVKPEGYFEKGSFDVYTGDALNFPFILSEDKHELNSGNLDKERVLTVPMELYPDFKSDIIKSLQDLGGISTGNSNKYLPDPTNFKNCCKLRNLIPDVITVDFYDTKNKIIDIVRPALSRIPRESVLFIHIDLGLVKDKSGIGICYFDHWDTSDGKNKEPYFIVPLALGISRKKGQETSIFHIYDFIMDLNKEFEIGCVSADQFQSKTILQNLTREGVPTKYISLDRTDTAHINFKNIANREMIEIVDNQTFIREVCDLEVTPKGKVDHPVIGTGGVEGSKDISDGVIGAVYSCSENLDLAQELSGNYKSKLQLNALSELTSQADEIENKFNNMLQNIF